MPITQWGPPGICRVECPRPAVPAAATSLRARTMPVPAELIGRIERLDPMPMTAHRLMRVLQDDDAGPARIAGLVEFDPAMASAVLRLANSGAYGGSVRIANLREAVARLGTAKMVDMVLGDSLQRLKTNVPMYGLGEDELWLHSVAASLAVRAIQQERRSAGIPEAASVAALLHDIGKLVMARFLKADVQAILARSAEQGITFVRAERELLGCDHAEVGGALGRHWGLPDEMIDAIEHHHDTPTAPPTPLRDAVVVANIVAKTIGAGLGAEGHNLYVDANAPKRLGLDFAGFSRVTLQTMTSLQELKASYNKAA
jgi:putative nucleotidyltransferase with HDIG domain